MNDPVSKMSAPEAAFEYCVLGYGITSWPKGKNSKVPKRKGWQTKPVDPHEVRAGDQLGILHGFSNTLIVDVDDKERGLAKLRELGLDPDDWDEDARVGVMISGSGKPNYLFSLPEGHNYRSRTYQENGQTILEFRTGPGQMDLLPPSLHPSGERHKWVGKIPVELAPVPQEILDELSQRDQRNATSETDDTGKRPSLEQVEAVIALIPNDDVDYDRWFRTGCAIHWSTKGSDEGVELFHRWSESSDKYDGDVTGKTWDSMGGYAGAPITFGTLCQYSMESDPGAYVALRERFALSPKEDFASFKSISTTAKRVRGGIASVEDFAEAFVTSDHDLADILEADFIYESLVIQGKITVFFGRPGHGKTTIAMHIARELGRADFNVFYILADIAGSDMPSAYESCFDSEGRSLVRPIFPNARPGQSMATVIDGLKKLASSQTRLDRCVFFFDTFKKMASPNLKDPQREIFDLLRELNGRGATILILAHTNKYEDDAGFPVPEGTNDLVADSDCSVLFYKWAGDGDTLYVSTYSDKDGWDRGKFRGLYEPITFRFHLRDRDTVEIHDQWINTVERHRESQQLRKVRTTVDLITAALCSLGGSGSVGEITDVIHESSPDVSPRGIRDTLNEWASKVWEKRRLQGKNKYEYVLKEHHSDDEF